MTHKNHSMNASLVIMKVQHGVLDILEASWRGHAVAELVWVAAGVQEGKDNTPKLKGVLLPSFQTEEGMKYSSRVNKCPERRQKIVDGLLYKVVITECFNGG